MQLALRRGIRVEEIDGESIVLDRSGAVVHHVSGDGASVLSLVLRGTEHADVPTHLVPALEQLIEAGVVRAPDWSRRRLLQTGGAGLAGAALITVGLASPAAAASGSTSAALVKDVNGNNNPPLGTICTTGGLGNAGRGSTVWTRTETPALISVTITTSTGTSPVGREVYILQSASSTCVGGTAVPVGVWAPTPAFGPQTFFAPIVGSATKFVVALQLSGGGGNDGWSSHPVTLA